MLRDSKLFQLLQDWSELTSQETRCIAEGDWSKIDQLHTRKAALRSQIEAEQDFSTWPESADKEQLREYASKLCDLEEENRKLVEKLMDDVESRLKSSDRTMRSLRHVQQAYGSSSRCFWESYS